MGEAPLLTAERELQLRRFNQRTNGVRVIAITPPDDPWERYFTPLPPPSTLRGSADEAFRSNALRSAVERAYASCAACYAPFFRAAGAISSWRDPLRSASWASVRSRSP
jgi:hypothetical protein